MKYLLLTFLALSFNFNQLVANVDIQSLESSKNLKEVVYGTIVDLDIEIWYDPDGAEHTIYIYLDDGSRWITLDEVDFNRAIHWNIGDIIKIDIIEIQRTGCYCGIGYNSRTNTSVELFCCMSRR